MRYLVPLWLILIAGLSLAPFYIKYHLGATGAFHFYDHIGVFLITTLLVSFGATDSWTRLARAGSLVAFAVLCEWLELAVYGNFRFEWHDVVIDWTGVALGLAISTVGQRVFKARRGRDQKRRTQASAEDADALKIKAVH